MPRLEEREISLFHHISDQMNFGTGNASRASPLSSPSLDNEQIAIPLNMKKRFQEVIPSHEGRRPSRSGEEEDVVAIAEGTLGTRILIQCDRILLRADPMLGVQIFRPGSRATRRIPRWERREQYQLRPPSADLIQEPIARKGRETLREHN